MDPPERITMLTITRADNGNTITGPVAIITELSLLMAEQGVDFTVTKA